jgi:hypothetical protein
MSKFNFIYTLLIFFTLAVTPVASAQFYYEEGFYTQANGTTSDADDTPWSVTTTPVNGFFAVLGGNDVFYASNTDSEGRWQSGSIPISGTVTISINVGEDGTLEGGDYIRAYYYLNGSGTATQFGSLNNDFGTSTFTTNVTGTSVIIEIRILNDSGFEGHYFDDVRVNGPGGVTLYSRNSGDYDNANTWSLIGHSGATCSCYPDETSDAIIDGNDAITIDSDFYVNDLTIGSTGSLSWTRENMYLFISNSGSLTVDGSFTSGTATNSYLLFNGGGSNSTLDVNSGSTFDINYFYQLSTNQIDITGDGDINVNYLVFNNDNATIVNNNTGDLNMTTSLYFNNGDTGNTFTNNGTVNVGGDITILDDNNSIINNGTFNVDDDLFIDNDDNTITNNSIMVISDDILVNDNGDDNNVVINAGALTVNDDINTNNATFIINNSSTINHNGDFVNIVTSSDFNNLNGSTWNWSGQNYDTDLISILDLTPNTNEFNYARSGNQPVIPTTYFNFRSSGSGSKLLDGDVTVANSLILNAGYVEISGNNLIIDNSGSISGGSSSTFVVTNGAGELIQNNLGTAGRTGNINYPVGISSASYTPLTLNNSTGTADNFGVNVGQDVYDNGSTGTAQTSGVIDRTWYITEAVAGGSDVSLTFQWNLSNELTSVNRADLNSIHWNGSFWDIMGNGAASGAGPYSFTISGVNDFSPFALSDASTSTLPVDLKSFDALLMENMVELEWTTTSESNNDYFEIQKSEDGDFWLSIGRVQGKGTTNELSVYQFIDRNPLYGISYYRLKQVDLDGKYTILPVASVDNPFAGQMMKAAISPNPTAGDNMNLTFQSGNRDNPLMIEIRSLSGELRFKKSYTPAELQGSIKLNTEQPLEAGIYLVSFIQGDEVVKQKLIVTGNLN